MAKSTMSLRPNTNDVSAKIMEGEAIIIYISSGVFYSMGTLEPTFGN